LHDLLNATLHQEEQLALTTSSQASSRLLDIAHRRASEPSCQIEMEHLANDEYCVDLWPTPPDLRADAFADDTLARSGRMHSMITGRIADHQ
jgi:hypothetical protein